MTSNVKNVRAGGLAPRVGTSGGGYPLPRQQAVPPSHRPAPEPPRANIFQAFSQLGFSLVEVTIAIVIMAVMLTGVFTLYGRGQSAVRRAEAMMQATLLARTKMAELTIDLEKRGAENKFPESDEQTEGEFEEPHAGYRYRVEIKKIAMPQIPASLGQSGDDTGGTPAANPMQLLLQQLKLDESIREVLLTVWWTERGRERSVTVATHVVKLQ